MPDDMRAGVPARVCASVYGCAWHAEYFAKHRHSPAAGEAAVTVVASDSIGQRRLLQVSQPSQIDAPVRHVLLREQAQDPLQTCFGAHAF